MKSFKGHAYIVALIILGLQLVLILTNQFYAGPIYGHITELRAGIHIVDQGIGRMILPISVLKNVQKQLVDDRAIDPARKARILIAFDENLDVLQTDLDSSKMRASQVADTLKRLQSYPLISMDSDTKNVVKKSVDLVKNLEAIDSMASEKPDSMLEYETYRTERISKLIEVSSDESDSLMRDINIVAEKMAFNYMRISMIFFLMMLLSAISLVYLLWHILQRDIPYLTKALQLLNRFEPDIHSLPKVKAVYNEEKAFVELTEVVFKEQQLLNDFKEMGNRHFILDDIIDELFHMVQTVIPVDRIGVAFIDHEKGQIIAEHGISNYGNILLDTGYMVPLENSSLATIVKTKKSRLMPDIDQAFRENPNSLSLRMILQEGIHSNMIVPLISGDTVFGLIFFSSRQRGAFNTDMLTFAESLSHELASIINKTYFAKKMFSTMTRTFADLVDRKDNETGDHIGRMTEYCVVLATRLLVHPDPDYRVKQCFINDIQSDACVHDIGKVAIPDSILKKPGSLTAEEWITMKSHVVAGHEVLQSFRDQLKIFGKEFYQMATDIVLCHHEKWDGSGYPVGLSGKGIPLAARIVAIADVFDAVTSKRVYKEASGFDEAVEIIREGSGKHFDPVLVQVFNESLADFRRIHSNQK